MILQRDPSVDSAAYLLQKSPIFWKTIVAIKVLRMNCSADRIVRRREARGEFVVHDHRLNSERYSEL
jgi:hypothetical protein